MARTARRVESLLEESPELESALELLLDRTDGGTNEVTWADVRDDLTTGQWGRLIETGVLTDGNDGFRIAHPDEVADVVSYDREAAISTPSPASTEEPEEVSWTMWDKAAAVASLGLFAGYSIAEVRNVIGRALDVFLGPLDAVLPFYAVIMALAMLTGLYSTLLQANLMDMEVMGQYQARMKDIQERQKAAKEAGDDEALEEIRAEQMEAMGDQLGMFKAQFRPMVWIMLLTIPVFLWMYWMVGWGPGSATHLAAAELDIVLPLAGDTTLNESIFFFPAWIAWYFVCSMAFTQIIRKALHIQTTPTG